MREPMFVRCVRCDAYTIEAIVWHCRYCGDGYLCGICFRHCDAAGHPYWADVPLTPQAGDRCSSP